MSAEVLQSGLLQGKIPRRKGAWIVYYLELTQTHLRVFQDSDDCRKHLYSLKLNSRDEVTEESSKSDYKFHISTSSGKHTFKCHTSEQRREWTLKVQKIITRAQLDKITDLPHPDSPITSFNPDDVGHSVTTPKCVEIPKPPMLVHARVPTVSPVATIAPTVPTSVQSNGARHRLAGDQVGHSAATPMYVNTPRPPMFVHAPIRTVAFVAPPTVPTSAQSNGEIRSRHRVPRAAKVMFEFPSSTVIPPLTPTVTPHTGTPHTPSSSGLTRPPLTPTVTPHTGTPHTPSSSGRTRPPLTPTVTPHTGTPHTPSSSGLTRPPLTPTVTPHTGTPHTTSPGGRTLPPLTPKKANRPPPLKIPADTPVARGTDIHPEPAQDRSTAHRRIPVTPKRRAPPVPVQNPPSMPKSECRVSPPTGKSSHQTESKSGRKLPILCKHQKPTIANAKPPVALSTALQRARGERSNPIDAVSGGPERKGEHSDESQHLHNGDNSATFTKPPVSAQFHHQLNEKLLLSFNRENQSAKSSSPVVCMVPKPKANPVKTNASPPGAGFSAAAPASGGVRNRNRTAPILPQKLAKPQNVPSPLSNGVPRSIYPPSGQLRYSTSDTSAAITSRVTHSEYPNLDGYSWYWGPMSREECEQKLRAEGAIGNIVVRVNNGKQLVISCWQGDGIHHHRVVRVGQVFSFELSTKPLECHSLLELLDVFMKRNSMGKNLSLFGSGGPSLFDSPSDRVYNVVVISELRQPDRLPSSSDSSHPSASPRRRPKPLPPLPSSGSQQHITQENPHYIPSQPPQSAVAHYPHRGTNHRVPSANTDHYYYALQRNITN